MDTATRPPAHLSAESRKHWRTICDTYSITDSAGKLLLQTALEALDRMKQAQLLLAKEGLVTEDRRGIKRAHPATALERDSRVALLRALAALNLDLEPLNPGPGRPPNKR